MYSLRLLRYTFLAALSLLLAGCEDLNTLLPDAFQEEEFEISDLDRAACDHLNDTSFVELSTKGSFQFQSSWVRFPTAPDSSWIVFPDTEWVWVSDTSRTIMPLETWIIVPDSSWVLTPGDSLAVQDTILIVPAGIWESALNVDDTFLENKRTELINALTAEVFDTLEANNIQLLKATSHTVDTPSNQQTNYVLFENTTADTTVFFIDDNIYLSLLDEGGTVIQAIDNAITLESIAGCQTLKTRSAFSLEEKVYLVRFEKTDQTAGHTYHVAVLYEE